MKWLSELNDINVNSYLENDVKLIYEACGIGTIISLYKNGIQGMKLYIPSNGLDNLKREYLKRKFTGNNFKEMVVTLNVSESQLNKWVRDSVYR